MSSIETVKVINIGTIGTLFKAQENTDFNMVEYVKNLHH